MFTALYLAAFTWTPGKAGFHRWYRLKLMGIMSVIYHRARRRARGLRRPGPPGLRPENPGPPIRIDSLDARSYDEVASYTDPDPFESVPVMMPDAIAYMHDGSIMVRFRGEDMSLREWAPVVGVSFGTLYSRYRAGWDVAEMFGRRPRGA
jgi:hypothetical protein